MAKNIDALIEAILSKGKSLLQKQEIVEYQFSNMEKCMQEKKVPAIVMPPLF